MGGGGKEQLRFLPQNGMPRAGGSTWRKEGKTKAEGGVGGGGGLAQESDSPTDHKKTWTTTERKGKGRKNTPGTFVIQTIGGVREGEGGIEKHSCSKWAEGEEKNRGVTLKKFWARGPRQA